MSVDAAILRVVAATAGLAALALIGGAVIAAALTPVRRQVRAIADTRRRVHAAGLRPVPDLVDVDAQVERVMRVLDLQLHETRDHIGRCRAIARGAHDHDERQP